MRPDSSPSRPEKYNWASGRIARYRVLPRVSLTALIQGLCCKARALYDNLVPYSWALRKALRYHNSLGLQPALAIVTCLRIYRQKANTWVHSGATRSTQAQSGTNKECITYTSRSRDWDASGDLELDLCTSLCICLAYCH